MLLGQELKFKNKLCNLKLGIFFSTLQFLFCLAGSGRNEIVSAMNIEDSMGILTLLDLIDEAMILLGHHLA